MKQYKRWKEKEASIAIEAYLKGYYVKEISQQLEVLGYHRSPSAVRHFLLKQVEGNPSKFTRTETKIPSHKTLNNENKISVSHCNTLNQIEDERKKLFNNINREYSLIGNPSGPLYKIVSISDLHIPFVNKGIIEEVIEKHKDAEMIIINGDILDQYSVSRWPKSKEIILRHEYHLAVEYIKLFSNKFKKVILTRGNHDDRVAKYFASNIDPGVSFLVHPDPLERIANGFDFTEDGEFKQVNSFDNVYYHGGICGWWVKVGKAIFAHPSGGSSVPMKTGVSVANFFLEKEDFDSVIVGHSHKLGKTIWKNKLVIEQGCCCLPMDYETSSKMTFGQQYFGYAVIYMDYHGNVCFDKSHPVYFGSASATDPKTKIRIGD